MRAEGPNLGVLHDQMMGFFQDACENGPRLKIRRWQNGDHSGWFRRALHRCTRLTSHGTVCIADDVSRQRRVNQYLAKTRPPVSRYLSSIHEYWLRSTSRVTWDILGWLKLGPLWFIGWNRSGRQPLLVAYLQDADSECRRCLLAFPTVFFGKTLAFTVLHVLNATSFKG